MNPACELCRGACCEGLRFPVTWFQSPEIERWFSYHGVKDGAGHIYLSCQCCQLDKWGKCHIYDTRPDVCEKFAVGCEACLAAVRRNRSEKALEIFKLIKL